MWKCCDIDDNLTLTIVAVTLLRQGCGKLSSDIDDNLTLIIVAVTLLRQGCENAVTLIMTVI